MKKSTMTDLTVTVKQRVERLNHALMLNQGRSQELYPLAQAWLARSRKYRTGTRARRLAGLWSLVTACQEVPS